MSSQVVSEEDADMLSIDELRVYFDVFEGTSRVLDGVSLKVHEREVVGLVGETGCGKSVTVKALLGSLPIPPGRIISGEMLLRGRNVLKLCREERFQIMSTEISYIPQNPMIALNPTFTIGQQMCDLIRWQGRRRISPLAIIGLLGRGSNSLEKAIALLDRVKMPSPAEIVKKYPIELSGGMRQRVLIAMALIGHPYLLVADEPTTALDVTIQKRILELIEEKIEEEGISVIYITHDLGVVRRLSTRIYVMYAGNIVEVGNTKDLLSSPRHPYTVGLIESIPKLTGDKFKGIDGKLPDYTNPPSGCRFHPRCPQAMKICECEKPELVNIGENHWVACHLFSSGGKD